MAFFDDPIIDNNSKASEESVLDIKKIFSQKNGFLSREEHPDFGADLDIELITKESGASGRKFAVQIKSSHDLNYLSSKEVISFSIETSRLGYLCRRTPGLGLVVLYDSNTNVAYYDYVELIYNRLIDDRDSDNWKHQENVSIHIPTSNKLDKTSSKEIYKRIDNRYSKVEKAVGFESMGFKVPLLNKEQQEEIDFEDPIQIAEALEKYGVQLINSFEYDILHNLISSLPIAQITSSKELLFISAVTYSGIGKKFDADYFIKKSLKRVSDYSTEEKNTLELVRLNNDLEFGRINYPSYLEELQNLKKQMGTTANSLLIEIEILKAKVTSLFKGDLETSDEIENELLQFFDEIENAEIEERLKYLLKIYHSDNIGGYAHKILFDSVTSLRIREEVGVNTDLEQRISDAKHVLKFSNIPYKHYQEAIDFARNNDDELLQTYTSLCSSEYFLRHQFGLSALNGFEASQDFKKSKEMYQKNINSSIFAYNKLFESGHLRDALKALHNASELSKLFKYLYDQELEKVDLAEITKRSRAISRELDVEPFESIVDNAFQHITKTEDDWSEVKDGDEYKFAKTFADAMNLDDERIPNIVSDIMALKLFEKECDNPNIKLVQNLEHTASPRTMYAEPPTYKIRDMSSGFESRPSKDVEELLDEYEYLCKKDEES